MAGCGASGSRARYGFVPCTEKCGMRFAWENLASEFQGIRLVCLVGRLHGFRDAPAAEAGEVGPACGVD